MPSFSCGNTNLTLEFACSELANSVTITIVQCMLTVISPWNRLPACGTSLALLFRWRVMRAQHSEGLALVAFDLTSHLKGQPCRFFSLSNEQGRRCQTLGSKAVLVMSGLRSPSHSAHPIPGEVRPLPVFSHQPPGRESGAAGCFHLSFSFSDEGPKAAEDLRPIPEVL